MKIYLRFFPLLIASALVLATACSDDQGLEKYQQESETKWLGNDVDPNQTWMTGIPVYLNITAPAGSTITAQSSHKQLALRKQHPARLRLLQLWQLGLERFGLSTARKPECQHQLSSVD